LWLVLELFTLKQPSQLAAIMMVISRFAGTGFSAKGTISIISPAGQLQTQEVNAKTGNVKRVAESFDELHLAELKTLNDLHTAGWRVKTTTQVSVTSGTINETDHLLEK
jgi:galactokinase/mevalonate kinase-like predicted kinase